MPGEPTVVAVMK